MKNNTTFFKNHFWKLFAAVLFLAAMLRFPFLTTFPSGMVQDEVGLGYTAISIAETGKDEWGNPYPMVFKSFGDYKPPAFFYTTALVYKVVGWVPELPRLTSAIAGLFVVAFGVLWMKNITKSEQFGLLAGLFLAVSPWTVHLSRMALESNLGLAFFFGGLYFYSTIQHTLSLKENFKSIFFSALFFSASTYAYHGFRFTIILFLTALLVVTALTHIKKIAQILSKLSQITAVLLLSTVLSLPGFMGSGATNRLDQTLILTSDKTIRLYEHYENNCHATAIQLNPRLTVLCKLYYNKFSRPILIGADSFAANISPGFLFFTGDSDVGRNPTEAGEFFIFLLPFWMIGILYLAMNYKKNLILIVGYVVAVIPSTLAGDPHAIRLSVLIPFVLAVIVFGIKVAAEYFKKNVTVFWYLLFAMLTFFTGKYILDYSAATYAAHEDTMTYLTFAKKVALISHEYVENGYVVYADHDLYPEPHVYYAYWNQINPEVTQQSFANVYQESAGFERPVQFGERMLFKEGNIRSLVCDPAYTQQTVFITNDPINFESQRVIQDNTNTYTLIHIYELDALRADPIKLLNFCTH